MTGIIIASIICGSLVIMTISNNVYKYHAAKLEITKEKGGNNNGSRTTN